MYDLLCKDCGATARTHGDYESDTNYTNLDGIDNDKPIEWRNGKENCGHDNFDVIDYEPDDSPFPDDVL